MQVILYPNLTSAYRAAGHGLCVCDLIEDTLQPSPESNENQMNDNEF